MLLMIPRGYETAPPNALPAPAQVERMTKFNDELQRAGVLVALDGLLPPSAGARVTFLGGTASITDGPFDTPETLGGYWLLRVKSRAEAIQWATRCPAQKGDVIEVREVHEASDFPEEVTAQFDVPE